MNFSLKKIHHYCSEFSSSPPGYLRELERETHLKTLAPQMISGGLQGRLLSMISHMIRPEYVVEVGTFTGYAALCLAEGLQPTGKLITVESNSELSYISTKYFEKSGFDKRIQLRHGDAREELNEIEDGIDLVFIDAGKLDYAYYYEILLPKMRQGGFLLADNVLWSGKVVSQEKDVDTQIIHDFNQKVKDDDRVENVILPIRDGLMLIRKK